MQEEEVSELDPDEVGEERIADRDANRNESSLIAKNKRTLHWLISSVDLLNTLHRFRI